MSRMQQVTLLTGLYAAQGLPYGFFTLALPVLLNRALNLLLRRRAREHHVPGAGDW